MTPPTICRARGCTTARAMHPADLPALHGGGIAATSGAFGCRGAGTVHLQDWADGEWLKQLAAEQLVTVKTKRGFSKLEWQKLRERNEALDCRVYARAAA